MRKAVYGMLPKNNMRKVYMSRLKLFADSEHPYGANILKDYEGESVPVRVLGSVKSSSSK